MAYQMKPSAGVPEVVVEDAAGRVFEDQGSADPGLWFGVPGREIGAAGAARLDWPFQDFGSCGLGHLQDGGLSARVGVAGGLGLGCLGYAPSARVWYELVHGVGDTSQIELRGGEIDLWKWVPIGEVADYAIPRLARRLTRAYEARQTGTPLYLERGAPTLR